MKRKFTMFLSVLLILSVFLTGCGGDKPADVDTPAEGSNEEGAKKDTLNFGVGAEPTSLDGSQVNDLVAYAFVHQIYDYLIDYRTDGTLAPGLAESWDYSEDGTELTFHLRDDVKFHNGDIMTAEDVAFSLNNAIQSQHTARVTSVMDSAEVVDEKTVVLKLEHAFGPIEYCVASSQMGIINKAEYEKDPEGYGRNPIGTGPYEFVEWKSGDQITFKAFEDYYKGVADIKNLNMKIIIDKSTQTVALENGEIDILDTPQQADRLGLMENDDIEYYETEVASTVFVAFNNKDGRFADPKLRQAIAHAVDKESMILGAVEGVGSPIETPMAKDVFGWPEDFKNREYDIEKAKELLAEAGYPDGLSVVLKTQESPTYSKPTEVFQDQLRAIGIEAEIEKMERGAYLEAVNENQDYEISISALSVPYPDSDYLYALFHSSMMGVGRNFFNANSPELDALLEEGRLSNDTERREEIYREVCEYFIDDPIMVPLYSYMTPIAADKNLKGVMANPTNRMFVYDYSW